MMRIVICLALCVAPAIGADTGSVYVKTLTEKNIAATTDGINKYLRALHPSKDQQARVAYLIEQLGSTDGFSIREEATAKLIVMPQLPRDALTKAAGSSDPEVRWRARQILEVGKPESEKTLYAVLRTIDDLQLENVTAQLLRAVTYCDKRHLRYAWREAVKSTARPGDAKILRQALAGKNPETRIAAAAALGHALGKDAMDDMVGLLEDPEDQVRLAAARAMANTGDRRSLSALAALMSSSDKAVRVSSSLALRELTGQSFQFAAYHTPDKRDEAIEKWMDWIAANGAEAELHFPLNAFGSGTSYLGGNTLISHGERNLIEELDPSGKQVWSYTKARSVWSAEKLANGNVLLAAHTQRRVLEIGPEGETVWEFESNLPLSAEQLPNGNYLIAEWSGSRAIEVDRDKKVVWEYKTQGSCSDAHRLPNGNTLVGANGGGVKEISPEGEVVWEYTGANGCYGCQPLPNGNVLIADFGGGRAVEVNREKEIVWEFKEGNICDAFRLPNGNTLITTNARFVEITPDKEEVWKKTGNSYGSVRR